MPKYLVRLIFLFLFGAATVVTVRSMVVPRSFWMFGHYRGKALGEISQQEPKYAGRKACNDCHSDLADMKDFRHARVPCETCHGPARDHVNADDQSTTKPSKDIKRDFCLHCHEKDIARPSDQPQVDRSSKVHKNGEEDCRKCHTIHKPTPKTHHAVVASPAPTSLPAAVSSPAPAASSTPDAAASPVPASPEAAPSPGPAASAVPGGRTTP